MSNTPGKPIEKQLIDITLSLIDGHRGLRGLTLREITGKAGCRHTNLYNYFDSFEELLWYSLAEAIKRNMEFTDQRMAGCSDPEQLLVNFAGSQVEFAANHPGLYHFMWLETLHGTPPAYVNEVILSPMRQFQEFLRKTVASNKNDEEIEQIADIIHGYLHGEICKFLNGRIFGRAIEDYSRYIVGNLIRIISCLT